ncbi:M48 family metalloprotease [Roseimaritima ulvae]|uniref:Peptidase family M48 n=1 Tax=Roseimaritima ulvae TaxID=980254 RepID=A0A5B9QWS1_9BACT|nr:M48 family metalloprotease [Roseimaritima ulvae]QEG42240.1 Peptidase family M48 [Roseimaritima ulvae]
MPLYWFLLVVVSLGCGSVPGHEVPASRSLVATMGVLLAWGLLAKVAALITTKQLDDEPAEARTLVRIYERQITILRWAGIVAAAMCLVGFGLAGVIDSLSICQQSMAVRAVLMICPGFLISLLVWWADHQFGVAHQLVESGWRVACREAWASFRLQGAWLVIPLIVLMGLIDLLLWIPGFPLAASGATVAVIALLTVPLGMPWLARRIWKTSDLRGSQYEWLHELTAATGMPALAIRRWDTGYKSCNALVAGFVPGCRVMLLTDRLLQQVPAPQLAMIALHEIAHLRRWHVPMRMAAVLPAWGVVWLVQISLGQFVWAEPLGIASAIAISLAVLHWVSYRTELDADATACWLAVQASATVEGLPTDLPEATRLMAAALDAVTADSPPSRRGTWLHPSVPARQQSLAAC